MKELKDQIIDVFKTYERLCKKIRNIEDNSHGDIIFGYPYGEKSLQIYSGVEKIAELLSLDAEKTYSGIEAFPVRTSVRIGNIDAFQIDINAFQID